jgi:hypothetical protein
MSIAGAGASLMRSGGMAVHRRASRTELPRVKGAIPGDEKAAAAAHDGLEKGPPGEVELSKADPAPPAEPLKAA